LECYPSAETDFGEVLENSPTTSDDHAAETVETDEDIPLGTHTIAN
jgi:hypothetical protein